MGDVMTMYFYDDFWESLQNLPDRADREAAAYAMLEYYFSGESTTNNPIASMAFQLVKGRIDKSIVNQKNGSKGGVKKWQNRSKTEAKQNQSYSIANSETDSDANSSALEFATTNPNSNPNPKTKPKPKKKTGTVNFSNDSEQNEYPKAFHCLELFNEALGRRCRTMQHEVVSYLESLESMPSDNEITSMVKAKEKEWGNDEKTRPWVNQDTLFRARNFLGYIDKTQDYQDDDEWMRPYIEHAERNKVVLTGTPNSDDTPWPFEEVGF